MSRVLLHLTLFHLLNKYFVYVFIDVGHFEPLKRHLQKEQRFPGHMPCARLVCKDLCQEIITSYLCLILSRAKEGSVLQYIYLFTK